MDGAGWSERAGAPLDRVAALPDSVSFEQAASLPIAGIDERTALLRGGDGRWHAAGAGEVSVYRAGDAADLDVLP